MNIKNYLFLVTIISLNFLFKVQSQETHQEDLNCYSVLVGRNATIDGSVMFAHNEDDWGERIVNWYKVPQSKHNDFDSIVLKNGGKMKQANETWSYLWLELPELEFSDTYMNEWGVTIASDACRSREDEPELTDGGIGYWLRRAMAERAKSAKEAVKIGGELIEQYGYSSSGRTYCIADPNEAWMMSVVNGKHWVAQRIPDDHVAIIPNYYTISSINLYDTANFLGSPDIFKYAIKKDWSVPTDPGDFSFRESYSEPKNLEAPVNKIRHWRSINLLSQKQYDIDDKLPFSFKPKLKISLADLYEVLRDHNEGTAYDKSDNYTRGNPHKKAHGICSNTTQYGFVAQLRSDVPADIGVVMWLAPFRPCVHPFVPWYFGMTEIPEGFAKGNYISALDTHFDKIDDINIYGQNHQFPLFTKYALELDNGYGNLIEDVRNNIDEFENGLISKQNEFEKEIFEVYKNDPDRAKQMITEYSLHQIQEILNMIKD